MLKVISVTPHKSIVKEAVCRKCGATIEYTPNDVIHDKVYDYSGSCDAYNYFKCPNCSKEVEVK